MVLDHTITRWINSLSGQSAALDQLMLWVTLGGPTLLVITIAIRWWSRTQREFHRHLAIACGLSTALGLAFNQVILLFYHRARPYDLGLTRLILEKSADPSFPSDHATVGFAITACLFLTKDRQWVFYFIASIFICLSRIYVGTHYVSDTIGGAFTGVFAAVVVTRFYAKLNSITSKLIQIF